MQPERVRFGSVQFSSVQHTCNPNVLHATRTHYINQNARDLASSSTCVGSNRKIEHKASEEFRQKLHALVGSNSIWQSLGGSGRIHGTKTGTVRSRWIGCPCKLCEVAESMVQRRALYAPVGSEAADKIAWLNTFSVATQFTASTGKRVNVREKCHWSHACKSFKRTCVGSNSIPGCTLLSKNAHRA
jgi:hypothetical protein